MFATPDGGSGQNVSFNWIMRGYDWGFHALETTTNRIGINAAVSANFGWGYFVGDSRDATLGQLLGNAADGTIDLGELGAGYWASFSDNGTPAWVGGSIGVGEGGGASGGAGQTNELFPDH